MIQNQSNLSNEKKNTLITGNRPFDLYGGLLEFFFSERYYGIPRGKCIIINLVLEFSNILTFISFVLHYNNNNNNLRLRKKNYLI